jgi:hypothetical protein
VAEVEAVVGVAADAGEEVVEVLNNSTMRSKMSKRLKSKHLK